MGSNKNYGSFWLNSRYNSMCNYFCTAVLGQVDWVFCYGNLLAKKQHMLCVVIWLDGNLAQGGCKRFPGCIRLLYSSCHPSLLPVCEQTLVSIVFCYANFWSPKSNFYAVLCYGKSKVASSKRKKKGCDWLLQQNRWNKSLCKKNTSRCDIFWVWKQSARSLKRQVIFG